MEKEKIEEPFKYDTPTNMVEKEGELFRGMSSAKSKSLFLRIITIIFSLIILVIPGGFVFFVGLASILSIIFPKFGADMRGNFFAPLLFGGVLFLGGIVLIYRNIKK